MDGGPHQLTCTPVRDIIDTLYRGRYLKVQHLLAPGSDATCPFQQNPQLSIGMRRTNMFDQLIAATGFAHHLHRHRARGGTHFPHEHAPQPTRLVSKTPTATTKTPGRSNPARKPAGSVLSQD